MGRLPGLWMIFSTFLTPPPTHPALPPFSFMSPSISPPPETERGEEEEEEDEEDGGLAMESMPWIASRVLGEAGASSLCNKKQMMQTSETISYFCKQMMKAYMEQCVMYLSAESRPATCLLALSKSKIPPAPPFTPWTVSISSSVV